MGGLAAIIMLFSGTICASCAAMAMERAKVGGFLFFTALSLFNFAGFLHAIQS